MSTIKDFQTKLGVTFSDISLLEQALTHRSYLNENREESNGHNERLEFLGDAVLELATTDRLYRKYPSAPEGELTAYRAALVNTLSLASISEELGLNDYIRLSKGESRDVGRARQFILANAVEAIIGALYLDKGYSVAEKFVATYFYPKLDEIIEKRLWQDAKSLFQEKAQEKVSITPEYNVVSEEGPDHDKTFTIAAFLGDLEIARGTGLSKQEAEQSAARAGLAAKGW